MGQTKRLTVSALLTGLSVVLLYFGTLFSALELSLLMAASFLVLFAMLTVEGKYPWLLYGATAVLSALLPVERLTVLLYLSFFGIYPLLKFRIEKLPKAVSLLLKLLWLYLTGAGYWLLLTRLFAPDTVISYPLLLLAFLLMNLAFFLYDKLLTRFLPFYMNRLEPHLHSLLR